MNEHVLITMYKEEIAQLKNASAWNYNPIEVTSYEILITSYERLVIALESLEN